MTEKTLEEVTTIEFKRPLKEEEVKDLLLQTAKNLPYCIYYDIKENKKFGDLTNLNDFSESLLSVKIGGTIFAPRTHGASFSCENLVTDPTYFSSIKFHITPGYDLEEHSKEQRDIWDAVRNQVEKYFSEK